MFNWWILKIISRRSWDEGSWDEGSWDTIPLDTEGSPT